MILVIPASRMLLYMLLKVELQPMFTIAQETTKVNMVTATALGRVL